MSETHAHLPAAEIVAACAAVKQRIHRDRVALSYEVAREMRRMRPWLWLKPIAWIARELPPWAKSIVDMNHAAEEMKVDAILDLGRAVMAQDPTFQVMVSASDFQLIKDTYR